MGLEGTPPKAEAADSQNQLGYLELVADEQQANELIEGSYVTGDHPLQAWERGRKFIADELHHDGTILDIGCANGFFLKSLEEWSSHKHEPYGIDLVEHNIDKARQLYPNKPGNFKTSSLDEFLKQYPKDFPKKFDFIYWGVWTNHDVTRNEMETLLDHISDNGRLLLGFYPDSAQDPSDLKGNIKKVEEYGYKVTILTNKNYPERNEKIVVIDKMTV